MRVNFRVRDPDVIAHLEQLEAEGGRGARSRACNEALEASLGQEPMDERALEDLKALVRQLIGIGTNINQIAHRANVRDALSTGLVDDLGRLRDELQAAQVPLRRVIKKWSR